MVRAMGRLLRRVVREEAGGEVMEYALIAGLIIVTSIVVVGTAGKKLLARWYPVETPMPRYSP